MKKVKPNRARPRPLVDDMIACAFYVCKREGYDIRDIEYESAVYLGISIAYDYYRKSGRAKGVSPTAVAAVEALRCCADVTRMLSDWRKQDEAGAERKRGCGEPTSTPISLTDFELLSFVAAHGRMRAAKLLMMTPSKMRDLLDEIALRMRLAAR